ncbi:complex I assembly factor TIMMDC1, mitochondrial, partial [Geospiza fortis]|uniref:Complex I assembly factor TIMMDC1, mitochondrial n=1 Tax=Geospiza fortis TaxID=48883 RepID=A0A8N5ET36_GEOFO
HSKVESILSFPVGGWEQLFLQRWLTRSELGHCQSLPWPAGCWQGAVSCDVSSLSPQQSAHRAGLRSFVRYGWRWSWRVAAFATVFNVVSTGLSAYRDKTTISNFAAAGAFTGALFRMHLGLQGLAGGVMFGTAFGIPAGGLLMAMYGLAGETLQEKRSRERRELYEQRLADWQSRLSMTEILGQTESNAQGRPEMERARELKSY